MLEEHRLRARIYSGIQHPYKHTLGDFSYTNPAYTGTTLEGALNWVFAVLYPNTQPAVADVASLPAAGNTLNDYRVVSDDGDGKAASYRWEIREGDIAAKWYKIYDMDWGEDSILSNFLISTQDVYVYKYGVSDKDALGDVLTGELAGQHIFGGDLANQHLTLHANSGDGVGAATGAIQFDSELRPTTDGLIDLGDGTHKLQTGYFGTSILAGDITISNGSIVSSAGAISFGDENLTTTGTLSSGVATINGQLVLAETATPAAPAATFSSLYVKTDENLYIQNSAGSEVRVGLDLTSTNDNRLIRSDGTGGTALQESGIIITDTDVVTGVLDLTAGNLNLAGNSLISTDVNGDININPNGTGNVILPNLTLSGSTLNALLVPDGTGKLGSTGVLVNVAAMSGLTSLVVDTITLDGTTVSAVGILNLNSDTSLQFNQAILPATTAVLDLGSAAAVLRTGYFGTSLATATEVFNIDELMDLKSANYRDAGRTTPAVAGDALFWSGTQWLASHPDSEVAHSELTGITSGDAGHTQFVMLSGRSGGQTVNGSTDASENLVLSSTAHATKGNIFFNESIFPTTNANFTTSWQGLDLGSSAQYVRDVYSKGEFRGFRLENFTSGTMPASSANSVGRAVFVTDTNKIAVDTGVTFKNFGTGRFVGDQTFDGIDLTKTVDVSSGVSDARNCIVQLLDNVNNFERINCKLEALSATQVRITTNVPLAVGSYRLIVLE